MRHFTPAMLSFVHFFGADPKRKTEAQLPTPQQPAAHKSAVTRSRPVKKARSATPMNFSHLFRYRNTDADLPPRRRPAVPDQNTAASGFAARTMAALAKARNEIFDERDLVSGPQQPSEPTHSARVFATKVVEADRKRRREDEEPIGKQTTTADTILARAIGTFR